MVIAQILKFSTEVKDGTRPYRPVTNITLNNRPPRCRQNRCGYTAVVALYYRGSQAQCGRTKESVIFYPVSSRL